MRLGVKTLVWYLSSIYNLKPPIVDLGAMQSPNQIGQADLRPFFKGKEYLGCDLEMGPGVNRIENIEKMTFGNDCLDTILCLDTIEHIVNPLKALAEISRCIKSDGVLVITSHMYAPVHYDTDYWRFTPQCFREVLLGDFITKRILVQGFASFPELVVGIATKASDLPFEINVKELNSMLPWPYPFPFEEV